MSKWMHVPTYIPIRTMILNKNKQPRIVVVITYEKLWRGMKLFCSWVLKLNRTKVKKLQPTYLTLLLCVEWWSTKTGWHIDFHYVQKFMAQNGWGSMAKWVTVFERCARKTLVFRGVPFPVIAWPCMGLDPFELPQKGQDSYIILVVRLGLCFQ